MITTYYRPSSKEQVLSLLNRPNVKSICVCGSTHFGFNRDVEPVEIVDLQNIGLTDIHVESERLIIDGLAPLNKLIDDAHVPEVIKRAILHDFTNNQRNSTSISGALFDAEGDSILSTVLLAWDAGITLLTDKNKIRFGDWNLLKKEINKTIIEKIEINLDAPVEYLLVNKSPASPPMIILAVSRWKNNRIRIALGGGVFKFSHLVLDGVSGDNIILATQNSRSQYATKTNLSPYITEIIPILLSRLLPANYFAAKEKEGV